MDEVRSIIETVARESYGRLVAYLAVRLRDVAAAEDALGDAFLAALTTWPRDGLPDKPEAWLLATARNRLVDRSRREGRTRLASTLDLDALAATSASAATDADNPFPDERLKLMFVCAHPGIDTALHTPLMLQTVLGLDAAAIARAFLVSPAAMGQRLVRAKAKIRDAGIAFEVPDEPELPERLRAVLEAIYCAYGSGWEDAAGADPRARGLAGDAIWLARVLARMLPDQPEARGLLALVLYCESRRQARRSPDGRYIPLSEQDPELWSKPMIEEAEANLAAAAKHGRPGRFQLEAAIQSVHADRAHSGRTEWDAIVAFYDQLARLAPALGARVSQAAAVAELHGPGAALAMLDKLEAAAVAGYQPYWVVRGHVLQRLGQRADANLALDRAIGLTEDDAVRRYLLSHRG